MTIISVDDNLGVKILPNGKIVNLKNNKPVKSSNDQQMVSAGLRIAPLIKDNSVFTKTEEEREELKKLKRYHKQFGDALNSNKQKSLFAENFKHIRKRRFLNSTKDNAIHI